MRYLSPKSQSTLSNHWSTYLHLPLLFLPVNGWLMALLFPQTFSSTVGKSKYSYTLSGMFYIYDFGKAATFGVTNWVLRDTGTLPVKPGRLGSLHTYKELSLSQCNLTCTCLFRKRPATNSLSNADRSPEWSSYMRITTPTDWKQHLIPKHC
jgi:hypothetical protein